MTVSYTHLDVYKRQVGGSIMKVAAGSVKSIFPYGIPLIVKPLSVSVTVNPFSLIDSLSSVI